MRESSPQCANVGRDPCSHLRRAQQWAFERATTTRCQAGGRIVHDHHCQARIPQMGTTHRQQQPRPPTADGRVQHAHVAVLLVQAQRALVAAAVVANILACAAENAAPYTAVQTSWLRAPYTVICGRVAGLGWAIWVGAWAARGPLWLPGAACVRCRSCHCLLCSWFGLLLAECMHIMSGVCRL